MANRKGVTTKQKWETSDGIEHDSVNEANDHQGAVNELEKNFKPFMEEFNNRLKAFNKDHAGQEPPAIFNLPPKEIEEFLFEWEKTKNRLNRESEPKNESNQASLPGAEEESDQA